LEAKLLIVPP